MKRTWYLLFLIIAVVSVSCSEDDEKSASITIEQRSLQESMFSFYLYVDEGVDEGVAYTTIQEDGDAALTAEGVKQHASKLQMNVKSGGPYVGSFTNLEPQTSYVIYAFLEIDGEANGLSTMRITTP